MEAQDGTPFNRNVLLAVDESENARRAVAYLGFLLGRAGGFRVTLLHVISLPEDADPAAISATYRDGLLRVRVARRESSKPRQIQIH